MADFYIRAGDERPILGLTLNDDLTNVLKIELRMGRADMKDTWMVFPAEIVDIDARQVQVVFPCESILVPGLYWGLIKTYFSEDECDTETFPNDRYIEIRVMPRAQGDAPPPPL